MVVVIVAGAAAVVVAAAVAPVVVAAVCPPPLRHCTAPHRTPPHSARQEWLATKARRQWELIEEQEAARVHHAQQGMKKDAAYMARSRVTKQRLAVLKRQREEEEEQRKMREGALTVD